MGEANSWIALVPVDGSFQKILAIMHWFGSDKHSTLFQCTPKIKNSLSNFLKITFLFVTREKVFRLNKIKACTLQAFYWLHVFWSGFLHKITYLAPLPRLGFLYVFHIEDISGSHFEWIHKPFVEVKT